MTEGEAHRARAARRKAGISDLGSEMRQRLAELGSVALDTPQRRDAVAEIVEAFTVRPYELALDPHESTIDAGDGLVHLKGALVDRKSNRSLELVAVIERLIDLGTDTVEHVFLSVAEPYRDRRVAPRLMLQSFGLYDRLGLRRITVHAGLESGRFYWSGRVGFDFADEAQRRHVERWATFVLGALRAEHDLDGVIEPKQWALLGTEVDPELTTSFEELAAALPPRLPLALLDPNGTGVVGYLPADKVDAHAGTVNTGEHLRLIAEGNRLGAQDRIPVGKAIMLTGPDWYGVFDLSDVVRRREYEREARTNLSRAGVPFDD